MIVAEAPGMAFHLWTGDGFVTHHGVADTPPVMATFNTAMQPFVRQVHEEHAVMDKGAAAA